MKWEAVCYLDDNTASKASPDKDRSSRLNLQSTGDPKKWHVW
jgi:hypothetical protein